MADDAMDWNPTTPPLFHNPYSHPQYIPGGWPTSPPSTQHTTGIFARKRPPTIIARAAKRVCMGATVIGTIATLPIIPIYIIIRHFRNRERQGSRLPKRDFTRDRRIPPAGRARIAAAERVLAEASAGACQDTQSESQQVSNQSSTSSTARDTFDLVLATVAAHLPKNSFTSTGISNAKTPIQSPSVTSVTDTETTIHTPASARIQSESSPLFSRLVGVKRPRGAEEAAIDRDNVNSTVTNEQNQSLQTSESDTAPHAKRMKGTNHFVAGYKRSPIAYSSRGLTAGRRLKAIGSRVKTPRKGLDFWGGYEYEQPIGAENAPNPSEQLQSELDSSGPENGHVSDSPQMPPNNQNPSLDNRFSEESEPKGELSHDERWSSVCVVEAFPPDDCYETGEPSPEQHTSDIQQPDTEERLFYGKGNIDKPPRVKIRPAISAETSEVVKKEIEEEEDIKINITGVDSHTTKQEPHSKEDDSVTKDIKQANGTASVKQSDDESVGTESHATNITKDSAGVSAPDSSNAIRDNNPAAMPVTPMKVMAEKSGKTEPKTPEMNKAKASSETPAEKFSMLRIEDRGDNDTPKATPHSGTKTTRITRYREALEKAQKAKLEQYEILPVSDDWDKKVRKAIRQGIPDYLGPQDLARVVPQYASFGQDNWLNDETINKYLELVAEHGRKNDRPDQVRSHHTFNNFFYNNLRSKGPESVARWSKRAKIGGTNLAYVEKIFIPINSGAHWTLAVVEPTQKKITHYNSMRGAGTGIRACEDLKSWVALEQGKTFKEDEWTLTAVGESPQQTNSDDCGVFTITSARQIMLGYTPMSYGPAQIPVQRIRIVAELINRSLLKSTDQA